MTKEAKRPRKDKDPAVVFSSTLEKSIYCSSLTVVKEAYAQGWFKEETREVIPREELLFLEALLSAEEKKLLERLRRRARVNEFNAFLALVRSSVRQNEERYFRIVPHIKEEYDRMCRLCLKKKEQQQMTMTKTENVSLSLEEQEFVDKFNKLCEEGKNEELQRAVGGAVGTLHAIGRSQSPDCIRSSLTKEDQEIVAKFRKYDKANNYKKAVSLWTAIQKDVDQLFRIHPYIAEQMVKVARAINNSDR